MSEHHNTTQAPSQGELVSDDIFEALAQEPQPAPDSDNGSNAELEQLIGALQDLDVPGPPALPMLEDVTVAPEAPASPDAAMNDADTLRCPKCGSSNPRANRYCGMCAAVLNRRNSIRRSTGADCGHGMLHLVLLCLLTALLTCYEREVWMSSALRVWDWAGTMLHLLVT